MIPITEWCVEEGHITKHEKGKLEVTTRSGIVIGEVFQLSPLWDDATMSGMVCSPNLWSNCVLLYNKVDFRGYILGYKFEEDAIGNRNFPEDMKSGSGDIRICTSGEFWNSGVDIFRGGMLRIMSHPIVKRFFNILTGKTFDFSKSYKMQTLGGLVDWQNTTTADLKIQFKSLVKEKHRGEIRLGKLGNLIKMIITDGTKANKERAKIHIGEEGEIKAQLVGESDIATFEVSKEGKVDYTIEKNKTKITVDPEGNVRIETPKEYMLVTEKSKLGSEDAMQPIPLGIKLIIKLISHTHPCSGPSPQLASLKDALSTKHMLNK